MPWWARDTEINLFLTTISSPHQPLFPLWSINCDLVGGGGGGSLLYYYSAHKIKNKLKNLDSNIPNKFNIGSLGRFCHLKLCKRNTETTYFPVADRDCGFVRGRDWLGLQEKKRKTKGVVWWFLSLPNMSENLPVKWLNCAHFYFWQSRPKSRLKSGIGRGRSWDLNPNPGDGISVGSYFLVQWYNHKSSEIIVFQIILELGRASKPFWKAVVQNFRTGLCCTVVTIFF